MIHASACQPWQPDRQLTPAQRRRSYTTRRDTIGGRSCCGPEEATHMPKITPLSPTQLLVLTTAAERPDCLVYPLPATLRTHGASRSKMLASLLQRGLL